MTTTLCLWLSLLAAASAWGPDDRAGRARALGEATDASIARGDYQRAILEAQQAFDLHERLGQAADAAWDLNAIGLANQYLGRFDAALDSYSRALVLDRTAGSIDGEIQRLNNIGNVHFLRGRYADAAELYQEAQQRVDAQPTSPSQGRLRRMTLSNLAALNQRLGADERALDLYARSTSGQSMQPSEEAQLLVNQGALVRRLGDPVKALALYRSAQRLFAGEAHRDGEIGVWRNIGIVYALDLADADRALAAFDTALALARGSSNRRGEAQARLYRGEALRRERRYGDAARDLRAAFDAALSTGLVEEQWKALHGIGQIAVAQGDRQSARVALEHAVAIIESVRADLTTAPLRSEFLADKRDVYDALIWLRLHDDPVVPADVFRLLEQSRARGWQDRVQPNAAPPSFEAVQSAVPPDSLLLEYWMGSAGMALLWIAHEAQGVVTRESPAEAARVVEQLIADITTRRVDWRPASIAAGQATLAQVPMRATIRHLLVSPDGPLHFLPFEALTMPGSQDLAVERFDVTYLPSASLLLRHRAGAARRWAWPWQRQLVAFGAPVSVTASPLETRPLGPLPYANEEVRRVAGELSGRADLHIGDEAQKRFVTDGRLRSTPLVHFSTHAVADTRDPDRSRIVLAPTRRGAPTDYLFLRELVDLDLSGVDLVTLSACETARGKLIRGEGVDGFGRAVLAAGAASAVTTLWDIADRPSAELMTQFYVALGGGQSRADSLRQAKLQLLRSNSAWSHPYYWAGYLLTGDGRGRLPRVVPWSAITGSALAALVAVTAALRAAARAQRSRSLRRTAGQSRQSAPTR